MLIKINKSELNKLVFKEGANIIYVDELEDVIELEVESEGRTLRQNSGLHLFLKMLSEALNRGGLTMQKVLKEGVEISWTTQNAKEYLWKPVQRHLLGTDKTRDLKKGGDIEQVHSHIMRHLGEKFGLEYINFPSIENSPKETIEYPESAGEVKF